MIVNRAAIVGILSASCIFVGGQVYADFTSNSASVGSVTISTSSGTPGEPIISTVQLSANADTELYQHSPEKNSGSKRQINVISRAGWNARILTRFDLGEIPPGATIQSCQLHLFLSEASNLGSRQYGIFRIEQHANDWGEGNHLFSTSTPGESSWLWFARSQEWDLLGGDIADQPTAATETGSVNQIWNTWDLTPDCKNGGTQSWALKDMHEDNLNYTVRSEYQSRESYYADQQPYLSVTFSN